MTTAAAISSAALQRQVDALSAGIAALQAQHAVRAVLTRYMLLCDQPCADRAQPQLGELFAADAVWEGVGEQYRQSFGRMQGREQITAFLGRYLAPSTHFMSNVHFLTSEQIQVDGRQASGAWVMLQVSTYAGGKTELISARLAVDFVQRDDTWVIAHFRTRRLFGMPWHTAAAEVAQ